MKNVLWLALFTAIIPIGLVVSVAFFTGAPVGKPVKYVLIAVLPLFLVLALLVTRNYVSQEGGGLKIVGFGIYSVATTADRLKGPGEIAPAFNKLSALSLPTIRTNGVSFPGYHVGWFRLRSGSDAFVMVTDAGEEVAVYRDALGKGKDLVINSSYVENFIH